MLPNEIIVVDSASSDQTAQIVADHPRVKLLTIQREQFDHGGTRDMALRQSKGDIICLLTQDALPMDDRYIEELVAPFADEKIASVCGRQVAYPDAKPEEILTRKYNYPAHSFTRSNADSSDMGIKAYFLSDACSAYRRTAYLAAGGFESPILTNEDMLMASKLLKAGWKIAYSAEACVLHSHSYPLKQDFKRSFDIGLFLKRHEAALNHSSAEREGKKYVFHVCGELLKRFRFISIGRFVLHCAVRYLGSYWGKRYQHLDRSQILKCTGNPTYWEHQ